MFKYFNQFMAAERDGLDVLILDEAHRIRETSADRYTRAALRTGRPQLDELIAAARVPVFLLDEHQVVRPGELGTADEIEQYARQLGHNVHRIDLDGQFRAGSAWPSRAATTCTGTTARSNVVACRWRRSCRRA
jgi:uncharacterized protein